MRTQMSADGNNLQIVTQAQSDPTQNATGARLTGGSMSPISAGGSSFDADGNRVFTFTGVSSLKGSQPQFTVTLLSGSDTCYTVDVTSQINGTGGPPAPATTPVPAPPEAPAGDACSNYAAGSPDHTTCENKLACKHSEGQVWVVAFQNQCVDFVSFVKDLYGYITMFAAIIAGFVFLVGAYNYLGSRGDPSKLAEGREMITNAIIGLILIGTAFAIVQFLNGAFQTVDPGINLLGPFGGP